MGLALRRRLGAAVNIPLRALVRREYERQRFKRYNERPVEFAFVFRAIARLAPRTILDVGTGTTALPHLMRNCGAVVTATDNVRDYWPRGMTNRHFHVVDDDIRHTRLRDSFEMVTCISTLEHIVPAHEAVRSMLERLTPGGHLVITCPYTEHEHVDNVYALPESSRGQRNSYVAQSFSRADLDSWFKAAEIVEQEFWRYWTGPHWTEGDEIIPPEPSRANRPHQHICLLIRKPVESLET
ncbi:MAG TPA: methyltransferase domain-containing protein [Vicinamibacterales bacterium]|jgi:SAM-dependent methyltransferase|nr:methyltransferase domain-containing protein [Vicinamibacterales bacterium]